MSKTIVVNNCARLIIGQLPHIRNTVKDRDGKERPGIITAHGDSIAFHPGMNIVDSDALKTLRANGFEINFTEKIKGGRAPEIDQSAVGKVFLVVYKDGLPDDKPMAKLTEQEAAQLVDEVDDEKTLDAWLSNEGRESVRAALYRRKKKISGEEN